MPRVTQSLYHTNNTDNLTLGLHFCKKKSSECVHCLNQSLITSRRLYKIAHIINLFLHHSYRTCAQQGRNCLMFVLMIRSSDTTTFHAFYKYKLTQSCRVKNLFETIPTDLLDCNIFSQCLELFSFAFVNYFRNYQTARCPSDRDSVAPIKTPDSSRRII